jgi:uncharacterized glyoxalase superfamily protein PhnB/catechol 2,3-dioxygenase-like lactoylglutathione lyase family enzyme
MPDPFDLLRTTLVPAEPDPTFVVRLRDRLARALDLPKGVTVSDVSDVSDLALQEPPAPVAVAAVITPYLAVADARGALDWYAAAFGARLRGEPIVMPNGTIGHAELDLGGAMLMLSEEQPEIGVAAPVRGEGVPVTIHLEVIDVDAVIMSAVGAGARLERPAADYDYGRNGVIRDPFGHRWIISAAPSQPGFRHGDIGYASLWVPDVARAASFFTTVLGWHYAPAGSHAGRQVQGLTLHHGMWGGVDPPTLFCCFAVDDLAAAMTRVVAAGGTANQAHVEPFGLVSECTDDQGTPFAMFEPPGGVAPRSLSAPNGSLEGDLAYITMEVVDSARTRAFYGSVLGWHYSSGHIADGWQVDNVTPMVGLSGGHGAARTVPMYRVGDIAAAVDAVRDAGGTATDPERQPYWVTATCTDDQGTRFYLGQLSP